MAAANDPFRSIGRVDKTMEGQADGPTLWTRALHRGSLLAEDVGLGLPEGPLLIETLHRFFSAAPGGDWMMACHAVRLPATAPKDRTASEHADWVATMVESGRAVVQVPDYALCVHTRAGQQKGRGLVQWWENGAQVVNEVPVADHRFRDELITVHREDERINGTEPAASRWERPGR